jgi:hypothetical protein
VEVVVNEGAVSLELLAVRELGVVPDLDVAPLILEDAHAAARHGAECAPGVQLPDRPREVVVQAGQGQIG